MKTRDQWIEEAESYILNGGSVDKDEFFEEVTSTGASKEYAEELYSYLTEVRLYFVVDINERTNDTEIEVYGTETEALREANYIWDHLTNSEQSNRRLYVGFGHPTEASLEDGDVRTEEAVDKIIKEF